MIRVKLDPSYIYRCVDTNVRSLSDLFAISLFMIEACVNKLNHAHKLELISTIEQGVSLGVCDRPKHLIIELSDPNLGRMGC